MYRRMGPKELEKEMQDLRKWKELKEVLPEGFTSLYLTDGRLSDVALKSEYERGFVDCWNKLRPLILDRP